MKPYLTLCLMLLASLQSVHGYTAPTYAEYRRMYNKNYNEFEVAMREKIYNKKVESFANITGYIPRVNKLTDFTDEELRSIFIFEFRHQKCREPFPDR